MTAALTKAEGLKTIAEFRDRAEDVLRSEPTTFTSNLRQLVILMRESPLLDRLFATELKMGHFESWLHAVTSTRELRWPDDPRERLFLQNRLLCAIADEQLHALKFAAGVFPVRSGESALAKFLDQIVRPFARDYLKVAQSMVEHLPAGDAATPVQPTTDFIMDIFISHSSQDEELAGGLAHLFQIALTLDASRIRCTSVNGFRLTAGAKVEDRIKAEVHEARVLVGLITPTSVQSSYVLFELGARWSAGKFMAPLLARGAAAKQLPGPIDGINALRADDEGQMHQFLRDIAGQLGRPAPDPAVYAKHLKGVVALAAVVAAAAPPAGGAPVSDEEKKILRLLWDHGDGLDYAQIAAQLKLSRQDAEFYANELEHRGWVHIPIDSDAEVDVTITQDGRRYLKTQGLA